jgi:hypothetical protein
MTAYKFRTLLNIERIFDIIFNKRFYAAPYMDLNDPMEGFLSSTQGVDHCFIQEIENDKKRIRICSFSKSHQSPLLWTYYADSFRGVCFEVELEENGGLHDVIYSDMPFVLNREDEPFRGVLHYAAFLRKFESWAP